MSLSLSTQSNQDLHHQNSVGAMGVNYQGTTSQLTRAASVGHYMQGSNNSEKSPHKTSMAGSAKEISLLNDLAKLTQENRELTQACQQ